MNPLPDPPPDEGHYTNQARVVLSVKPDVGIVCTRSARGKTAFTNRVLLLGVGVPGISTSPHDQFSGARSTIFMDRTPLLKSFEGSTKKGFFRRSFPGQSDERGTDASVSARDP